MSSGRILIVSNRLPVTHGRGPEGQLEVTRSSGGLVTGLREVHEQAGALWIGHTGLFGDEHGAHIAQALARDRLVPVTLDRHLYDAYYSGLSNGAIWPLFHYRPESMRFSPAAWSAYEAVNARFADVVASVAEPGDRVWVHDYQLMLLPALLRERRPDLSIAYFHHIPFPSAEVFRIFPRREALLRGLLGADLIGFHTIDYVHHFAIAMTRHLGLETLLDAVEWQHRTVLVGAFPLGIDARAISDAPNAPPPFDPGKHKVMLGIDRLDYTKGIPERLLAFRDLLQQHPELVGTWTLLQVCVPSRGEIADYKALQNQVERLVGHINGAFARPGYTPIQYLHRSIPYDELIGLYRMADVALVTPLRDGLNLVCKEYVAARNDDDGVLVLSELAGAASEMGEALIVNPFDQSALTAAMYQALSMPAAERRERMQAMRSRLLSTDTLVWARSFIARWGEAPGAADRSQPLQGAERDAVIERLAACPRLLLALDHDGTLTPIAARPELATPSRDVAMLLASLAELPGVEVSVITGRDRAFCDRWFAALPIHIVAEHGAFLRRRGDEAWQSLIMDDGFAVLLPELRRLLAHYTRCVPGSFVEEKECSIVWHYRQAEPVSGQASALALIEALGRLLRSTHCAAFRAHRAIDVRPESANKGRGVSELVARLELGPGDLIFGAGDDVTDEDIYRVRPEAQVSIHIGTSSRVATYHLATPIELHALLTAVRDRRAALPR